MTRDEFLEKLKNHAWSFDSFSKLPNKLAQNRRMHGLLLMQQLIGDPEVDVISGADHDMIYLEGDLDSIAEEATDEIISQLSACNISWFDEYDSFTMGA